FAAILPAETQHGFAEIHDAIVGSRTGVHEIHLGELRVLFEQHRDRSRTLRRLAARAAPVFRDVGADDDRLAAFAVVSEVANRAFHAVHAAQARVLELRYFTASR